MDNFVLPAGKFTPEILLDAAKGHFVFQGECFPSSRRNFFVPVYDWIQTYLYKTYPTEIILHFDLTFMDTASVQSFLRILQLLDDYTQIQEADIRVRWHYEEDDLDMLGVGQDYAEDVSLTIELIPIPPREEGTGAWFLPESD
ncbi:MAG: DUF1987 domain-containing protein [Bernardetiaceae bacterium]